MHICEPVKESDFARLYEIETAAHSVPWSYNILSQNQGANYLNLKLIQQDTNIIIGFAICHTVLDEATLYNIALDPNWQNKGLGHILLQELIAQLQAKQINTLWLEVRASNQKAQYLYTKLGFNKVTVRHNYYVQPDGSKEDAIIMALYI